MPARLDYQCPVCDLKREFIVPSNSEDFPKGPVCPRCLFLGTPQIMDWVPAPFATRLSSIHTSERPIVFRNPRTGELRYPPRNDSPMSAGYAAEGFVREEAFSTFAERDSFERSTGKLHERSHYDPGSATAERALDPAPERSGLENKELATFEDFRQAGLTGD